MLLFCLLQYFQQDQLICTELGDISLETGDVDQVRHLHDVF